MRRFRVVQNDPSHSAFYATAVNSKADAENLVYWVEDDTQIMRIPWTQVLDILYDDNVQIMSKDSAIPKPEAQSLQVYRTSILDRVRDAVRAMNQDERLALYQHLNSLKITMNGPYGSINREFDVESHKTWQKRQGK